LNFFRSAAFPYIAPFAAFVGLLWLVSVLALPGWIVQAVMIIVPAAILIAPLVADIRPGHPLAGRARSDISFAVRQWGSSTLLGILVFVIWIGPDLVFPHYRGYWLFTNSFTGAGPAGTGAPPSAALRGHPWLLLLRTIRASAIVPAVEELFWRSWMMRWLIREDFLSVPLGAWAPRAFWIVAVLFASEHGPYWDVGLAAGVLYNWWMLRSRSLGDLILAHAVTNFCLSVYVVAAGHWEYW
jgi:uncharacterized protein